MKVADATWQEIGEFDREGVVILPTGSLEQHGPHLPLITDSLIVTAVAEGVEAHLGNHALLLPTLWLGASSHHLPFAGTASAGFACYTTGIKEIIAAYQRHNFSKFLILNGHGGNIEPNGMALREAKAERPNDVFAQISYFDLITDATANILTGPLKQMAHACEAETSLVMHLRPDLVKMDKLTDDGMRPEPQIHGLVLNFDELSDEGSIGYATCADPEKGRLILQAAIQACTTQVKALAAGFVLKSIQPAHSDQ